MPAPRGSQSVPSRFESRKLLRVCHEILEAVDRANDWTTRRSFAASRGVETTMMIRPEQPGDHTGIDSVNCLAFGQPNEARLAANIRQTEGFDSSLSLVVVRDDQVVGHILFCLIHIEAHHGDVPALALATMAVLPECQRQGIGSELVRVGLTAARRAGHRIVVVVGHGEYYPRFGFVAASKYGLRSPFPVPEEAFMAMATKQPYEDGGKTCWIADGNA